MDKELLKELRGLFISEMNERISDLNEQVQAGNIEETRKIAHKIRGAGGTYGFVEVSEYGATIEEAAKANNWDPIKSGLDDLKNWLESSRNESES